MESACWVTYEQFQEFRDDVASRVVLNMVKTGDLRCDQLDVKKFYLTLPMEQLLHALAASFLRAEDHGLPLAYRMAAVKASH